MSNGKSGIVLGAIALIVAIGGVGLWGYDTFISPINPEVDLSSSLRAKAVYLGPSRTLFEANNPNFIVLPNESYDPGNHMENGNYTVSVAGYYDLRGQVTFTDVNVSDRFSLDIRNYTERLVYHAVQAGVENEYLLSVFVSTITWLNKGDEIYMTITVDTNGGIYPYRNMYGEASGDFTYFSVEYLGK